MSEKISKLLLLFIFLAIGCGDSLEPQSQPEAENPTTSTNNSETTSSTQTDKAASSGTSTATPTSSNAPSSFTIGGTISGLTGELTVKLNTEELTITQNGTYTFKTKLKSGDPFTVSVQTQPENLQCSMTSSSGTITNSNILNLNIDCLTAQQLSFNTNIQPSITSTCGSCHGNTKIAGANLGTNSSTNRTVILNYISNNSASRFRNKIQGIPSHGGGNQSINLPLSKIDTWFASEGL